MQPSRIEDLVKYPRLAAYMAEMQESFAMRPESSTLWIGAGYSSFVSGLPTWRNFLDCCLALVPSLSDRQIIEKLIEGGRMRLAAEFLHETLGTKLFKEVKQSFSNINASRRLPIQRFAAARIVTTNYDSLLEDQLPWYEVLSPLEPVTSLINSGYQITKIHGSVRKPESCILSSSSYARTYNDHFAWYLIHVFLTSSVVFIGCSMDQSEPYFSLLATIREREYRMPRHYALVSVKSAQEGKSIGTKLENLGIYTIPFIPDADYSNFAGLVGQIVAPRWTDANYHECLTKIRKLISDKRFLEAIVNLRKLQADPGTPRSAGREFADLVNSIATEVVIKAPSPSLYAALKSKGQDLGTLVITCASEPSAGINALDGFCLCLEKLGNLDRSWFDELDRVKGLRVGKYGARGLPKLPVANAW